MDFSFKALHILSLCVLAAVMHNGSALKCYACNVSTSTLDVDGCLGIGSLKQCAGSSVCLSATYEINSGVVKTFTTMQSCFPDMAGQECDNFMKSQKDLHRTVSITPNTCYTCHADNCNNKSKPSRANSLGLNCAVIVSSVLSPILAWFLIL